MILAYLIIVAAAGGLLAWLVGCWSTIWPRWISLAALSIDLVWAAFFWTQQLSHPQAVVGPWLVELSLPWIPQFGISFHLAIDGLSLLLVLLTLLLGIMSVAASWTEIQDRVGFFHFNLMWVLAGILGVFLAMDLFLFYFFWELMLVPMYFLIAIWGHENRLYAAVKFFLFTQLSGLLMLLAILGLYFVHGRNTGVYTFDYTDLLGTAISPAPAMLLMLGFFMAFAVKLPVVPVHTWLPDAHTEAPTAGSVVLAGLLLKTGAYGMLRFVLPLFHASASSFAPIAMTLAVVGILYGALLAFAQTDLKRLVAYTSVSHMGFVLLGIFAWNELAFQGAVIQILCHGIEHRRTLHPGGPIAGAHAHPRHAAHGRPLVHRAAYGRRGDVLRPGFAGPAGAGQLRRGVPGVAGDLPAQRPAGSPCVVRSDCGHRLFLVDHSARFPRSEPERLEAGRPVRAGNIRHERVDGGAAVVGHLPVAGA